MRNSLDDVRNRIERERESDPKPNYYVAAAIFIIPPIVSSFFEGAYPSIAGDIAYGIAWPAGYFFALCLYGRR